MNALTRKPGGQQSSTLEIKFADAYLVTWPNTRMDIVHPRSRQSPPAPYTTPPHLPTETRSTECAYRQRGNTSPLTVHISQPEIQTAYTGSFFYPTAMLVTSRRYYAACVGGRPSRLG